MMLFLFLRRVKLDIVRNGDYRQSWISPTANDFALTVLPYWAGR